jgi:hypothetical protein
VTSPYLDQLSVVIKNALRARLNFNTSLLATGASRRAQF